MERGIFFVLAAIVDCKDSIFSFSPAITLGTVDTGDLHQYGNLPKASSSFLPWAMRSIIMFFTLFMIFMSFTIFMSMLSFFFKHF